MSPELGRFWDPFETLELENRNRCHDTYLIRASEAVCIRQTGVGWWQISCGERQLWRQRCGLYLWWHKLRLWRGREWFRSIQARLNELFALRFGDERLKLGRSKSIYMASLRSYKQQYLSSRQRSKFVRLKDQSS